MRIYGKPLFEKNEFTLVEVFETDATGLKVLVSYAILDAGGNEIDFFESYDDALAEFQKITDDNEPPSGCEP